MASPGRSDHGGDAPPAAANPDDQGAGAPHPLAGSLRPELPAGDRSATPPRRLTRPREPVEESARRELSAEFRLDAVLSRGRGCVLYLAHELAAGRRVALRVLARQLPEAPGFEDRFLREMRAVAAMDHPHIATLLGYGTTNELVWCATRHVMGSSVSQLLRQKGSLEPRTCLRLIEQVGSALHYAHRRGVVHGDVRPANVLVDDQGWAFVTGFALGRTIDRARGPGSRGPRFRQLAYVAPEEATSRHPAPGNDQFGLAVTIFECLTGSRPSHGGPRRSARNREERLARLADLRPDLPRHLSDALERASSPQPADRFATILEFVSALGGIEEQEPPAPPAPLAFAHRRADQRVLYVKQPPATRPRPAAAAMLALAAIGGFTLANRIWNLLTPPPPVIVSARAQPAGSLAVPPRPDTPNTPAPPPDVRQFEEEKPVRRSLPAAERPPARIRETPRASLPRRVEVEPRPAPPDASVEYPPPAPGVLYVSSRPWGRLYVDGEFVGNTPRANLTIPAGLRRVRILQEGFRPFERLIAISPGQEVRMIDIVLEPLAR
jgi:serine/threonine-protein kinase